MRLCRIESEGLAHYSYVIIEGSRALVVDPRRDCEAYLDLAAEEGARITHVLETHRNEDYAIGSMELMARTGAEVRHGPGLAWDYGKVISDGEVIPFGGFSIRALHTPGHTEESMCYALHDRSAGELAVAVFTGDTLFVGDVGRTDLPGPEKWERLSRALHRSIHEKLLPLGDGCVVHPAHGAGSVCGADISDRPFSTIGVERESNPHLALDEDDFVQNRVSQRLDRPPYFRRMEVMNLKAHPPLLGLPAPFPLPPKEFRSAASQGAVVLDTRMPHSVAGAYIKGALSIWLDGLASYGGWLLPYDRPILLVVEDPGQVERAVRILVRIGYDSIVGYLKGGMSQWCREGMPYETLPTLDVHQAKAMMDSGQAFFLDPRPGHERQDIRVPGTKHIFVGELEARLGEVPRLMRKACMCSAGFRGGMAAVMLRNHGHEEVYNVLGGIGAWKAAGYPVEE